MKKPPTMSLNVVGGVMVFSDSWNYPKEFKFNGTWKVAIGLHPQKSEQFSEEICMTMANLMKEPGIAALGKLVWTEERTRPKNTSTKILCRYRVVNSPEADFLNMFAL